MNSLAARHSRLAIYRFFNELLLSRTGVKKKCVCNEYQRTHYMSKISGPLLDRIDLQIEVQPVDFDKENRDGSFDVKSASIGSRTSVKEHLQI